MIAKNQQPSEQPPDEKCLPKLGGIIACNSFIMWCPEGDLNPHGRLRPADFKSAASANFAIQALSHSLHK